MMCLGWFNQMDCNARPNVEVMPATQTAAQAAGITDSTGAVVGTCPNPLWFWIGAAVVVGAGVLKK